MMNTYDLYRTIFFACYILTTNNCVNNFIAMYRRICGILAQLKQRLIFLGREFSNLSRQFYNDRYYENIFARHPLMHAG